jgi:hypothetical protein
MPLTQDVEFFRLIERYKGADEIERNYIRERLDGNRRFQQMLRPLKLSAERTMALSSDRPQGRLGAASGPPKVALSTRQLEPMPPSEGISLGDTAERRMERRKHRDANRALWESTLPPATANQPGQITTGYSYDYIDHGESSRRSRDDFRTKPKSKRFNITDPFRQCSK